jgi:acetate kinase
MNEVSQACLLILNIGSSSVKFQLFAYENELSLLMQGRVQDLGTTPFFFVMQEQQIIVQERLNQETTQEQALAHMLRWLEQKNPNLQLMAAAHRVVHGGERFTRSMIVDAEMMSYLETLCPLAPLHQPHNIAGITILRSLKPDLIQMACFDTAFHSHHDDLFTSYALSDHLRQAGIRRYGFHGLSYEWLVHHLAETEPAVLTGKIIAAHLGNGASLCAIAQGRSVDTTMGLTALDGLPMGTRCGSIDPGAILFMMQELGLSLNEVEHELYNHSGLLGLSGMTNDVRVLQASREKRAEFALAYFCLKTAQYIAMMVVSMAGLDTLIFTGGIGENALWIRNNIIEHLGFLSEFQVRVIPANEEKMMAIHLYDYLQANA